MEEIPAPHAAGCPTLVASAARTADRAETGMSESAMSGRSGSDLAGRVALAGVDVTHWRCGCRRAVDFAGSRLSWG